MAEAVGDRQALIAGYLRERAGLARRGLVERVALVDAELVRLGHTPPAAPAAAAPMRVDEAPRARRPRKPEEA